MKQNLCWIVFCIDKSGSMVGIKTDMIGGFNSFIAEQLKANVGECRVFAYTFDTYYETLFENADIKASPQLTTENYVPRGGTALYDALGKTITDIGQKLSEMSESERPEKVLIVTITDGEDNSHLSGDSYKQYDSQGVKSMIEHQTNVYKWEFAYIGANQDVWAVGGNMGVKSASNLRYAATSAGTAYAFSNLARSTTDYRATKGASFVFAPETQVDAPKVNPVKSKTKKA